MVFSFTTLQPVFRPRLLPVRRYGEIDGPRQRHGIRIAGRKDVKDIVASTCRTIRPVPRFPCLNTNHTLVSGSFMHLLIRLTHLAYFSAPLLLSDARGLVWKDDDQH